MPSVKAREEFIEIIISVSPALVEGLIDRFPFQSVVHDELMMLRLTYSLIEIFIFWIKRSASADANADERIRFRSDGDDARLVSLFIIFATLWRCISPRQSLPSV